MKVLELHGVTVHGHGPEVVVLGNGFGCTQRAWQAQVARLRERYRVVTFDLAGSTAATLPAYQASRHGRLFGFAEDLVAIVDALDIRGAAYVGHSVSGLIGMLAVNADPGLFSRVVLMGASARYVDDPASAYQGGATTESVEAMLASMASDYAGWANGFSQVAMGNPDQPDLAADFASSLKVMRPDIACAVLGMLLLADHRADAELYGEQGVPTLLLQTARDFAVPLEATQWLARATRGELHLLDVDGHFPHMAAPELVSRAIMDFLARDEQ
ncbi:MAG: hypothetical protein RJA36_3346 [Pseudomonadota bacterium]|jgi:sigma-B regulation protein RsbQ